MKIKIIGAIICFMLIFPTLSTIANTNEKSRTLNQVKIFNEDINIELLKAPAFLGVNLKIENKGTSILSNVKWSFRYKAAITGTGIFINEKLQEGTISQISPDEVKTIEFRLLKTETRSPIGFGNIYMNASVETSEKYVRTQQRGFILGFFLLMFKDTYMDIKPDEAYDRLQNNEFDLVIDVVGLDIYSLGHLPGAVNYIWADGTLKNKILTLDPSQTYLVYCHTDPPSTDSAQAMVNAGFNNVYRLEGNYRAWVDAGYPIEI